MRSKPGRVCDFIEGHCRVPEGRLMGEWMVLEPWQGHLPEIELPLNERDTAAVTLAARQCCSRDESRLRQFEKLRTMRSGQQIGRLATYIEQMRKLELKPHETPPCWVDPNNPDEDERGAVELVRRMLKAGISQYHPDPMAALKEANWSRPPASP
jgi:hypothetical protein